MERSASLATRCPAQALRPKIIRPHMIRPYMIRPYMIRPYMIRTETLRLRFEHVPAAPERDKVAWLVRRRLE
jgi:hypothetical protein